MTRILFVVVLSLLVAPPVARAADTHSSLWPAAAPHAVWRVCFAQPCVTASQHSQPPRLSLRDVSFAAVHDASTQTRRPVVIEYSHGYQVRRQIHRYASFATLPLFGAELWLGQSMYGNTPSDHSARRTAHIAIGTGIVGLFGVNTVTGAWNLFGEGLKDPHGLKLRLLHGLLMMAADAGFAATTMWDPSSRRSSETFSYGYDKSVHRNLAIASISVGTAGYLVMLLGNR